jgi:sulfate adenylyltransferase
MSDDLSRPHGGRLVNLLVGTERAQELAERATHWQSWELSKRQLCDLELLLSGAFSPLQGFLGRSDYESVCASMRLADGTLWPIPVMLDVPESIVGHLGDGSLALRDPEGASLAVLHLQEIWRPDRPCTTTSANYVTLRPSSERRSHARDGAALSRSRHETRCTGRIWN